MASQFITIAKIGGTSGAAIYKLFLEWQKEGLFPRMASENSPRTQSLKTGKLVRRFSKALADHAAAPPIVFYAHYTDMWSAGNLFHVLWEIHPKKVRAICVGTNELFCCYSRRSKDYSHTFVKKVDRRLASRSIPVESRWFLVQLREAYKAWQLVVDEYCIVIIRSVVGTLVEDHEVSDALGFRAPWLKNLPAQIGHCHTIRPT